ncbi:MAG: Dyp-type peroxidase [Ornithinimicrobium sp.]
MMMNLNSTNLDITDPDLQECFSDLQGGILKSHGRDVSRHVFIRFNDPDKARTWVRSMATKVTTAIGQHESATEWKATGKEHLFVSLLLSGDGYRALGVDPAKTPREKAFTAGMKDLAQTYNTAPRGDHKPTPNPLADDPDEWEESFRAETHALVIFAFGSSGHDDTEATATVEEAVQQVAGALSDGGGEIACVQQGHALRNDLGQVIEHFGFTDGVSDPMVMKTDLDRAYANGGFEHYDPSINIGGIIVPDPGGDRDAYGSYVVYRKLQQNLRGFADQAAAMADALGLDRELAGALVMGRFKDGTPVGEQNVDGWRNEFNDFNYDDDWTGTRCPLASHTRRSNPRGDTYRRFGSPVTIERSRRIVRRGISYGTPELDPAEEWTDTGLLFMCYQANIEDQFIFIQHTWGNNQDFLEDGVGADPVAGQCPADQTRGPQDWPTQWGRPHSEKPFDFGDHVRMRGGEYFFAPSVSALNTI